MFLQPTGLALQLHHDSSEPSAMHKSSELLASTTPSSLAWPSLTKSPETSTKLPEAPDRQPSQHWNTQAAASIAWSAQAAGQAVSTHASSLHAKSTPKTAAESTQASAAIAWNSQAAAPQRASSTLARYNMQSVSSEKPPTFSNTQ